MSLDAAALPDDVETLRRLVLVQRRQSEQLAEQLQQAHAGLIGKALEIEKLKAPLAKLRRMTFGHRSEAHTSEPQSLMRISYAVFCLKNKTKTRSVHNIIHNHNTHKER